MNLIFFLLVAVSFVVAALTGGSAAMNELGNGAFEGAKSAVELAIRLSGAMTLFLGLMKVIEAAGAMRWIAWLIRPLMVRLFPGVPPDHPAMGSMMLNLAANVLGLGNAATPLGIKAMQELQSLNKHPTVATNAMITFLAINTGGVAVLPSGVIGLRAGMGAADPASVFAPTLLATTAATLTGLAVAFGTRRFFPPPTPEERHETHLSPLAFVPFLLVVAAFGGVVGLVYVYGEAASAWIIPVLIVGMLTVGVVRRVPVYEVFIEGARDGFSTALRIIPYLVAILSAVGMFRASGAMDAMTRVVGPVTMLVGMPAEMFSLAVLRSLSGTGAYGLMTELTQTHGPDSLLGQMAGVVNGSSETTFYVLAVYFGAVGVTKGRNAVLAGVAGDVAGALVAVWAVRLLIGEA